MRPSASQTLLVAGASGTIGAAVVARALERGWQVLALLRSDAPAPVASSAGAGRLVCLRAASMSLASLEETLAGHRFDALVSCVASRSGVAEDAWAVDYQLNRNLLTLALDRGCRCFVLLSAICVQKPRLAFQRAKLAFEGELAESAMPYAIVRATAFFKSLSGQIRRVRDGKPFLIFGDGEGTACAPIAAQDLATFLLDCIDDSTRHGRVLPLGGPGPALTPRAQGELLFALTGRQPRFRSVPASILSTAAAVLGVFGRWLPALAEKAELARIGHYYATESMLLWDTERERYDARATPAFGTMTLESYYRERLQTDADDELDRDLRLFDRNP
ncbi:MAG: NAD(P)H-binding protein [Pseudomonadota bacterium]